MRSFVVIILCIQIGKIQVLKSQLSFFYFGLAKTVVNKYLCKCLCFKSLYKVHFYALKDVCSYKTKVIMTLCAETFPKTMLRQGISLQLLKCPLFNQDQVDSVFD
jgi:hypothetical protein